MKGKGEKIVLLEEIINLLRESSREGGKNVVLRE